MRTRITIAALLSLAGLSLVGCQQQYVPPTSMALRGVPWLEAGSGVVVSTQCISNGSGGTNISSSQALASCATNQVTTGPARGALHQTRKELAYYPPLASDPRVAGKFCRIVFGPDSDESCLSDLGFGPEAESLASEACTACLMESDPTACLPSSCTHLVTP